MHIIRWLLNESFLQIDLKISKQITKFRALCSALLNNLVCLDENVLNDDFLAHDYHFLLKTSRHLKFIVRNKLKSTYIMSHNLSIKIIKKTCSKFIALLKNELAKYDLHDLMWENKFFHWYEQCSFIDKKINRRHNVNIENVVKLQNDEFSRLQWIFTHCMQYE